MTISYVPIRHYNYLGIDFGITENGLLRIEEDLPRRHIWYPKTGVTEIDALYPHSIIRSSKGQTTIIRNSPFFMMYQLSDILNLHAHHDDSYLYIYGDEYGFLKGELMQDDVLRKVKDAEGLLELIIKADIRSLNDI